MISRPSKPTAGAGYSACPTCRAVFRGGFARCPNDGARLQAGDDDPLVGSVLAERYQIEHLIGEGGIGRVYRARHVRMSRRYAVKVPFGELAYDHKVRARFANEAEAASRLNHPNVIGVVDVGETGEGLFYLAMDLAEGDNLVALIDRGPLPRDRALELCAEIADGLAHAHRRGLVHRDLKPDNIILQPGPDGAIHPLIVDFGLAILQGESSERLTTEGVVLGTPHYMAPEQATDGDIDRRTDLFALGLILYEMIAGQLPFDGSAIEVARQNLTRDLPPIATRSPGVAVDPLVEALIGWMTRKRAEDRPPDAATVAELARMIVADPARAAARIPGHDLRPTSGGAIVEVVGEAAAAARSGPDEIDPDDAGRAPTVASKRLEAEPAAAPAPAPAPRRDRRLAVLLAALALVAAVAIVIAIGSRSSGRRTDAPPSPATPPPGDELATGPAVDPPPAPAPAATADPAGQPAEQADDAPAGQPADDRPVREPPTSDRDRPAAAPASRPGGRSSAPAGQPDPSPADPPPADPPPADPPPADPPPAPPAPPSPDPGTATVAPPSRASLTTLYDRVGKRLNAAVAAHGADATDDLVRRFRAVPYLEATRKPALRAQAMEALTQLERELARL